MPPTERESDVRDGIRALVETPGPADELEVRHRARWWTPAEVAQPGTVEPRLTRMLAKLSPR